VAKLSGRCRVASSMIAAVAPSTIAFGLPGSFFSSSSGEK
jgi:hypothetical protein